MSKSRIPYFDFYPADFMHGVRGLTAQEVGVYTMILCRIYECSSPVEYNAMVLSTYCGMREATFTKTLDKLILLDKFQVADGMISNRRAMIEISSRADKLKNNSKAGKASAQKRQQKQRQAPTPVQQPFNHTDTDTDTDTDKNPPTPQGVGDGGFQKFWDAYPHRSGQRKNRKGAEAKFRAAIRSGVTAETIMAGVEAMKGFPEVRRNFARDPATWLNQQGWNDEPPSKSGMGGFRGISDNPIYGEIKIRPNGEQVRFVGGQVGWERVYA